MSTHELIVVRGIPGSGKSEVAKRIVSKLGEKATHLESSMYFNVEDDYKFKSTQIKDSHNWCLRKTKKLLGEGKTVVVANTFTRLWEMEPFLALGESMGVKVTVLKATGTNENTMGVPIGTIKHMVARWEDFPGEHELVPGLLDLFLK